MNVTPHFKNSFSQIIATLLIFLFIYTASSKLLNLGSFKVVFLKQTALKPLAGILSILIPSLELAMALLLFFPYLRRTGLLASAMLMTIFTVYIAYMLLFSSSLPCSCGGAIQSLSWKQHLLFNTIITFLSWLAFSWCRTPAPDKDFIAINRISRKPV
jgi:hypothetical protein